MPNDHLTIRSRPKTETPKQASKRYDAIQKKLREDLRRREAERKKQK